MGRHKIGEGSTQEGRETVDMLDHKDLTFATFYHVT